MRQFAFLIGLFAILLYSCATKEKDIQDPSHADMTFVASFEQPENADTRVFANENLLLRWTVDDRVSIFNKLAYNQQYKFTGETGASTGGFRKVETDEFVTGYSIPHVVSIYPYKESTAISSDEVISIELPAEQTFAEHSFGLGANTMISVSSENILQFKNACGYLRISLYGSSKSVTSIHLKGNNGEKIAGEASISMPLDGFPSVDMSGDATGEVCLTCANPVALGESAKNASDFWFVLPPVVFEKGFTIVINRKNGTSLTKKTNKSVAISRNRITKMSPLEVESPEPNNVIYYTSLGGDIVEPTSTSISTFGASIVSNTYDDGIGCITFDGPVTTIGRFAFNRCRTLTSMTVPESVESIQYNAFGSCEILSDIVLHEGLNSIEDDAFIDCSKLVSIDIPESVTTIGEFAFAGCISLSNITLPEHISFIGEYAFSDCWSLTEVTLPKDLPSIELLTFYRCRSLATVVLPESLISIGKMAFESCTSLSEIVLPDGLTSIGERAFYGCSSLSSIVIPKSVTLIDQQAFSECFGLTSITVIPRTPPTLKYSFYPLSDCPIYVPASRLSYYKSEPGWNSYKDRIQPFQDNFTGDVPVPEAVDLGLSVKWASFNLGASKPEEYGNYYAWGEVETKQSYYWSDYRWCIVTISFNSSPQFTKYCHRSKDGYNGYYDGLQELEIDDDAAHDHLTGNWRMPTWEECRELCDNCTWTWSIVDGVFGYTVASKVNGNSIFLPAAGRKYESRISEVGYEGSYWSSTQRIIDTVTSSSALSLSFSSTSIYDDDFSRWGRENGLPIRPVIKE